VTLGDTMFHVLLMLQTKNPPTAARGDAMLSVRPSISCLASNKSTHLNSIARASALVQCRAHRAAQSAILCRLSCVSPVLSRGIARLNDCTRYPLSSLSCVCILDAPVSTSPCTDSVRSRHRMRQPIRLYTNCAVGNVSAIGAHVINLSRFSGSTVWKRL